MNTFQKTWLLSLIFILLVVTIYLFSRIRGKFSVIPLNKSKINTSTTTTSKYKYFYEISSNTREKDYISWLRKDIIYHHNSDGLNNTKDYSYPKAPNVFRIAAIGDSFTYGFNVDTSQNWVSLVEQELNKRGCGRLKYEVLNFGVPGYDIDYAIERSKIKAEKYHPNLYIWFIKDDDFSEPKELLAPLEKRIYSKGKYELKKYLELLQALFNLYDKQLIINSEKKHLIEYLAKNSDDHFLIVFPTNTLGYPSIDKKLYDELRSLTSFMKNVDFLSIEILQQDTFFPNDFHLNIQGNKKFSQNIVNWLHGNYCVDK